jgi:hypothetical protein
VNDAADSGATPKHAASVGGPFAARLREAVSLLSKLALVLAVISSAVFLAPVAGVMFGIVGLLVWSGGRGVVGLLDRKKEATLAVEDGTLVVAGDQTAPTRRVPLSAMRSARVTPLGNGGRAHLVVRGRGGILLDAVLERRGARRLLRDLGLSARERPMTFSFFFGMQVTVGADGILVAWPLLRRRRFVRYAEIAGVEGSRGCILIRLRDHRTYEIMTTNKEQSRATDEHYALLERIEDAREVHHIDDESGRSLAAALARGGRSARAWVKDLAVMAEAGGAVGMRGGGYRAPALPKETLWRIALDPTETEELRIGAGLTLRRDLDDEGRGRLRAAAGASASPRVRVALAGAADVMDDDALGDVIAGRVKATR